MEDRVKALEGVRNFRDFGGYRTNGGAQVKRDLLFRSGHYAEATEGDVAALEGFGVLFQVDLRRPDERDRQPNKWPVPPVRIVTNDGGREDQPAHIAFLSEPDVSPDSVEQYMTDYYVAAPYRPHMIALYREWFDHLAETDGAALVNCAAGKDRTGIICALTLELLGVDEATRVEDYLLTNTAVDINARLPEATAFFNEQLGKDFAPDVYRPFMGVRERYLEAAIASMTEQSGSTSAYVETVLGVDGAKADRIRARLQEA